MNGLLKKILSFFFNKVTSLSYGGFKVNEVKFTPNPDVCHFQLNKTATESDSINYSSQDEVSNDSFAKAIFKFYGVESILIRDDCIVITKSPVIGWETLTRNIEKAIVSFLTPYPKSPRFNKIPSRKFSDNGEFLKEDFLKFADFEKEKIINVIFDQAVRPALAKDGGGLTLINVHGEIIRIRYEGACGTCPSSNQGTLRFIEETIQENLHPSLKVVSI